MTLTKYRQIIRFMEEKRPNLVENPLFPSKITKKELRLAIYHCKATDEKWVLQTITRLKELGWIKHIMWKGLHLMPLGKENAE